MILLKKNELAVHSFRSEGSEITEEEISELLGGSEFERLLERKILKRGSNGIWINFVGILVRRIEGVARTLVCYPK